MGNGNGKYKWLAGIAIYIVAQGGLAIWWASGTNSILDTAVGHITEIQASHKNFVDHEKLEGLLEQRDIKIDNLKEGQQRIETKQEKVLEKIEKVLEKLP